MSNQAMIRKLAEDSLKVVHSMLLTYALLVVAEKNPSKEVLDAVYDQVTRLRNVAYHAGMLPSFEEVLSGKNMDAVRAEFELFAKEVSPE